MLNIAHRGFKGAYPENTMLAYEKAIEVGADGIEFDVHLTKDSELVIIHDETLERTTDGKGLIKDKTLQELKKLNASKGYLNCKDQTIPTLREYFDFAKNKDIITNIELKTSIIRYEGIEKKVYDLINEYGMKDKIIISSFNHNSLIKMKEIDREIKCGVLESSRLYKPWEYVKNMGMEYFHPLNFTVNKEIAEKFLENNIGLNIWFGKADYDFSKCLDLGPTSLITDFPDKINDLLTK
ncbi:glycerophosphodiester phosphodiesterase [Anaerococcus prevotii]|uniref:Putative glycerophosphodiester phosphodiesterase n=1 Tax=Anaerococcus prevotii ACS-065-V-Col13 TaxID=879305 RepID=F0GTJ8_9FIRM|nr:glycerophosphodiester phosphodiesterase [Anaerococcus prevotii]EGC82850.1 putative glycerophosphodiester phosphodiesterase [Anaerococcus prevotii ACS-065-V-Col13]